MLKGATPPHGRPIIVEECLAPGDRAILKEARQMGIRTTTMRNDHRPVRADGLELFCKTFDHIKPFSERFLFISYHTPAELDKIKVLHRR